MNAPVVYNYESARRFLLDSVGARKQAEPDFSLRSLSKAMDISHTLLVMLLQGKRGLRVKHAGPIARGLNLSSQERLFLQALIQFDCATDAEEKHLCSLWLADLHPERQFQTRQIEEFLVISHWLHMAIFAMTDLKDLEGTAESLQKRLHTKVDANQVQAALERMINLGLIEKTPSGQLRSTCQNLTTPDDIANEGARKYHKGVMELAADALDKLPLDKREFQSFALAVEKKKIPVAKEMIRKFRNQFVKAMASEAGDEVYQMNLQFFQLTESPEAGESLTARADEGVDTDN